ncbi:flavin-containing monooxygenase [Gordonia terrae]|uniref:FAD-dependent oxidoreductase n=2 Tax=Gordonia terrae TaxID=2055 RepID=A0AAD0NUK4_9ACTN|nr:NAD(P)/FAD-dependent oxidoreductase [Gordonia terrae]VTR09621.1 4-hydroxyacetophenone monooxygenase [Clostridioides difficile]ANY22232.1 monooxygenase [Gordonia terrae]AWO82971.1 FAD-dependent oxidoreductase [Gordonia terrae]VTS30171.1 4-hydroxyacetophenone monooxygenase [Gordonia terrae]GAB46299.1 putative flavin-containing monooxygenase [Gordonia terrae NBRC 100016]
MSTLSPAPAGAVDDEVTVEALHSAISVAEPGSLLMAMIHVTGDLSLLDEFEARLAAARGTASDGAGATHYGVTSGTSTTLPGEFPAEVAEAIRDRAAAVLTTDLAPQLGVPDPDLFRRMASVCTTDSVADEFVPLLLEQAGFEHSRRRVPVTKAPPADLDVIVIGAGMIGLNAAIKLGDAGFSYTVFEARDDIGGTWSRNVYPGAAVDTPSHYYSYSFELNPNWSRYYPTGPEYLDYMHSVAEKHDLYRNIHLSTSVLSATWDESRQRWEVVSRGPDGAVRRTNAAAVITALGVLNSVNIPDIPGLDDFEGTVIHTAEWDPELDLTGKRVTVIGTGCTAVQVVANIVDDVAALDAVVRTPHWIVPEKTVVNDVPDGERWAMKHLPYFQNWFRLRAYWLASDNLYMMPRIDPEWAATHLSVSALNDRVLQTSLRYLDDMFPDRPDLKEKLTPTVRPYAKRIVKDPGFFAALKRDNVSLHRASPARVDTHGIILSNGERIETDVIVLATGFKVEYASFIDITGRNGEKLSDRWDGGNDPRAYLGIQVDGFPNLFVTAGPNAAPNHGAGHSITSEEHVHYIIECLQYLVENDKSSVDVRREALVEYNRRVDEALDKTVWAHPGKGTTGYYRNDEGRPIVPCPWRLVDYWTMLRQPDPDKLIFTERESRSGSVGPR